MKFIRSQILDFAFLSLLLIILVFSSGGHIVSGDEETMFRVTQNLLAGDGIVVGREEITLQAQMHPILQPARDYDFWTTSAIPGRDGKTYSKYGIGQSLVAIPLYGIGQLWEVVFVEGDSVWPEGWYARLAASMLNSFALFGCSWVLMLFSRELGFQNGTSRWLVVGFIFSTMAWPYVKTFYPQPSVTFLVLLMVFSAYQWRKTLEKRWLWILGLAVCLAILFRASSMIVLPVLVAYLIFGLPPQKRWSWVFPITFLLGISFGLTLIYNELRFSSFLETGYHEIAWTTPPILGLYGLLLSPGKGIVMYAPLVIIGAVSGIIFVREHRSEAWLFLGLWISFLLFYAPYNFWTGGFNWGPRFLLPVLPFAILPIGSLMEEKSIRGAKWLAILFISLGFFIQFPAIIVDHSRYLSSYVVESDSPDAYNQTIYNVSNSPILQQWPVAIELIQAYRDPEIREISRQAIWQILQTDPKVPNEQAILISEFLRQNTIDFWWLHPNFVFDSACQNCE